MEKDEVSLSPNEKIIGILKNENFIAKLNDAVDLNEIRDVFRSEGIEISLDKAKVITEALSSVNERIQNTEEVTDEELEEISDESLEKIDGGRSVMRKALELVFMFAVIAEGVRISKKVRQRGGVSEKITDYTTKGKNALIAAENKVVDWIVGK